MDDSATHQQLIAGLAFSGEITASVTHELNNVIGTIEQVTGLIEDLAVTDAIREAGVSDKLLDVVSRVTKQADRGTALIKRLNGFAHLSDNPMAECDLGQLVESMVALSARFASMRRVQLTTVSLDQSIVIKSNPFQVALAIFGGIKRALQIAKPKEPIEISLGPCERGGILTIDVRCDGDETPLEASETQHDCTLESVEDGLLRIKVMLQGNP